MSRRHDGRGTCLCVECIDHRIERRVRERLDRIADQRRSSPGTPVRVIDGDAWVSLPRQRFGVLEGLLQVAPPRPRGVR